MLPKLGKVFTLISLGQKVISHDIECKWRKVNGEGRQEVVRMKRVHRKKGKRQEDGLRKGKRSYLNA